MIVEVIHGAKSKISVVKETSNHEYLEYFNFTLNGYVYHEYNIKKKVNWLLKNINNK